MLRRLSVSAACLCLLYTQSSLAFFCPNNFNQIDYGYTTAQVVEACGKPDLEQTKEAQEGTPQEWNYFLAEATNMGLQNQQAQGTLKTVITFDKDGKAINISINGIGVGTTSLCGQPLTLGMTTEQVKGICGTPSFINKQQTPGAGPSDQAPKIIEYTYNGNPAVTLVFEGDKLTSKR